MKPSLKVACVGAGYFSQFHHDAWHRIGATELVGVFDKDLQRAKITGAPAFGSLEAMFGAVNPDILDIITPPETHGAVIGQAIEHGIGTIICQKPFCENLTEAIAVTDAVELAGVNLIIHENFRFQPWFRTVKQRLNAQALGDVHQAVFRLRTGDGQGENAYLDRQPYFRHMQRLLVHETAVHYIDTFRYLFGEAKAVYADLRRLNPVICGEDAGLIMLDYANQVKAIVDGNRHLDFPANDTRLTFGELLIEGSKATLQLTGDGRVTERQFGSTEQVTVLKPTKWLGFAGDCVHAFQCHVVEHLLNGATLENVAQDYLRVLQLEKFVYDSAEQGRKLYLDEGC